MVRFTKISLACLCLAFGAGAVSPAMAQDSATIPSIPDKLAERWDRGASIEPETALDCRRDEASYIRYTHKLVRQIGAPFPCPASGHAVTLATGVRWTRIGMTHPHKLVWQMTVQ